MEICKTGWILNVFAYGFDMSAFVMVSSTPESSHWLLHPGEFEGAKETPRIAGGVGGRSPRTMIRQFRMQTFSTKNAAPF